MKIETMDVMYECTQRSLNGDITFPELVKKLETIGVESYTVDLVRAEKTHYMPNGESHIEPMPLPLSSDGIPADFSAEGIVSAIQSIQRGEIFYVEFLKRIMKAGCTAYSVFIDGRRTIYFGRTGDNHVEYFPV